MFKKVFCIEVFEFFTRVKVPFPGNFLVKRYVIAFFTFLKLWEIEHFHSKKEWIH